MNTTIGTSQTSLANISLLFTAQKTYYCARFVSPKLGQTSITANTWTYSFATQQSNTQARFPLLSGNPVYLNIYVWRTSTQATLGTIVDGATANITYTAGTTERAFTTTITGSAVSSINTGDDVLVCEVWFKKTQGSAAGGYTQTFYFDGATENTTNNTAGSDHATFISTPETITFGAPPPVDTTVTGKTLYNKTTRHG